MQEKSRRSNKERTEATRAGLLAVARELFVEKGYAETGTPELVAAAGLTRGALYHHFADKQGLFRAVIEGEAAATAEAIERMPAPTSAMGALLDGSRVYLEAMTVPGRIRLLLIDGPAVLGLAAMDEVHASHGNRTLRLGLQAAMEEGSIRRLPLDVLTEMLGALFDRAALSIEQGATLDDTLHVIRAVLEGLKP